MSVARDDRSVELATSEASLRVRRVAFVMAGNMAGDDNGVFLALGSAGDDPPGRLHLPDPAV